jgi:hypothetical protein
VYKIQYPGCEPSARNNSFACSGDTSTKERAMSSKTITLALTVGLAAASAATAFEANSAAAADRFYRAQAPYDYAGPGGVYGPGFVGSYIYVRGHGILDAPCGLPTSACPNSERPAD